MQDKTTHASGHDGGGRFAGVKRLDLLSWRFSETEVKSLSLLQLVHRQQPNALDVPLEESRLRFARWLVEHGHLSEDVVPVSQEAPCDKEEKYPSPEQESARARPPRIAVGHGIREPEAETALRKSIADTAGMAGKTGTAGTAGTADAEDAEETEDATQGRRALRGVWSRLRRGMSWFATFWRDLTRPDYPPYGMGSWGTWGAWGSYGPYDPYGPRGPWGDPRSISDPTWYWMRYHRHDT